MDLAILRHSAAHVMAAAVCRLFQGVKLDIGPATDDGFYYDFDMPDRITPDHFPMIEKEMQRLVGARQPFEREVLSRAEAERMLREAGQTYKLERLADIPDGSEITFFRCGEFRDLCRGPHVQDTGAITAFKLVSVAGSYFRGVETNPMLQRIYGIVAESKEELDAAVRRIEEARERDHRKVGRELGLYSIQDDVGPGLVHWHPKGARIRLAVEDFWRREHLRNGYDVLYTPHIGRAGLWHCSGHLDFFRENMYSAMDIDGEEYFVKPMNCPFHIEIYKSEKHSYRELPLRWAELGTVYRYEKSGVLHGLLRVRGFTQDDAHIICTPSQMRSEVLAAVRFALKMFRTFGFQDFMAYLSTRPAKAVGPEEQWRDATESLEESLKSEGIPYKVDVGGGAFYGPKIDLKIKDILGREWQTSTIQFDFNLPERFDMKYTGEDGKEHRPYMVHRALLGSLERFMGLLVEHYKGAFPLWLAPEQVRILPLTDKQMPYAERVASELRAVDIRVKIDGKSGKIGAKIRDAQMERVPCMVVIGPKEEEQGAVSVRSRDEGDKGVLPLNEFVRSITEEALPGGKQR